MVQLQLLVTFSVILLSSVLICRVHCQTTENVTACEGQTISLLCNFTGDCSVSHMITNTNCSNTNGSFPCVNVTNYFFDEVLFIWTYDSMTINTTSLPCNETNDLVLTVDGSSSGLYECSVNGTTYNQYHLNVSSAQISQYPICAVDDRSDTGDVFVRLGDNVTFVCTIEVSSAAWSLQWSNSDNDVLNSISNLPEMPTNNINSTTYNTTARLTVGDGDVNNLTYTCTARPSDISMCISTCSVGPVYLITMDNFFINRSNVVSYSGDNITFTCMTNVPNTTVRWNEADVDGFDDVIYSNDNTTITLMNVSDNHSGSNVTCELYSESGSSEAIDERIATIIVQEPTTTTVAITTARDMDATMTMNATSAGPTLGVTTQTSTTLASSSGLTTQQIAIIGGVIGGVVLLVLIVVVVVVCRRRGSSPIASDSTEKVKRRSNKKSDKKKKHRSAILSLRHKLPLFSRPYDDTDDEDDEAQTHVNNAGDDNVDTMIMEYRPQSKIASQIRVDLDVDDEGEGTVENGFVPSGKLLQDGSSKPVDIEEGRYGIIGASTFDNPPQTTDSEEKTPNDEKGDSGKVGANTFAFDNALYAPGPMDGDTVDVQTADDDVNDNDDGDDDEADKNVSHYDVPKKHGGVDTEVDASPERESAMYAEINRPEGGDESTPDE